MKSIDKDSGIPLYVQLMDIVIKDIEECMKERDKLLSERDFCEKYDVSRSTVRQALLELESEGYIYKVHGKGTFVLPKRMKQDLLKFYSFTEEMKRNSRNPTSKVLSFEIIECNEKISGRMNLKIGDTIYKFTRLRLADDVPMIIETSYIPYNRFPGITKFDLESKAMYDIFSKRFNAKFTMAEEYFEPVMTNENEASHLKISKKIPSLKIERFTYEQGEVIEYTVSIARGDKFKYHVTLKE
ncbi:GntR family transcriptional regulator [Clostridium sp. CF012]|uniref:GntR family transcriptional regulator n=1 Tax=Clostridium sp. CF012 TaxID=2843319 RepID=UPI001C0BCE89|nr:GntR family transcriptional regulator [Clostridium sp. CF012]MBU3145156.1 GntR family transcriptional regulator [Clostridium sp. CF012]